MIFKRLYRGLRWIVILFFASSIFVTLLFRWVSIPVTPLMIIRCVQQIHRGEHFRLHHHWVPLREMSPSMPVAVMASEDQNFLRHHGFDANAIGHAVVSHLHGSGHGGGSTISQQTAKNVFLWPSRSWLRKGFEVYFTFLIELFWSKQRIMEVYLNSIEMGDGIYGTAAIAECHFSCSAAELSRRDCALIAATLPSPLRYSSLHPGPFIRHRQAWILKQMRHIPPFPMEE